MFAPAPDFPLSVAATLHRAWEVEKHSLWARKLGLVVLCRPSYFEEAGSAASRKVKKLVGRTWKRKGGKREEKKNKEKSKERRKGDFSIELNNFLKV